VWYVPAAMESRRLYKGDRAGARVSRAKPAPRVRPARGAALHVEIVVVGREILRGQVADTNSANIAADLSRRGALVHRVTVVDDRETVIARAVTEAIERGAALVVTTGGLGPTTDDCTLVAVGDALGVPLAIHPHATEQVETALRRLKESGIVTRTGLTPAREKLCAIPVGSEPIHNPIGVSPGILAKLPAGARVACLPGAPGECAAVWEEVARRIKELQTSWSHARREVEAPTADESALQPMLVQLHREFPGVWIKTYAPRPGKVARGHGIRLTFEAFAPTEHEAEIAVDGAVRRLLAIAGARG